jgi:signal transduction histidine kinase
MVAGRTLLGVALPPGRPGGAGVALLVVLLFLAVGAGAYPVVRRLTRRLEDLERGVEAFGAGELGHRVDAGGGDEVAALAASFNRAAARIEALVRSHQSLLANASHELRSPLARLKMAVSLLEDAPAAQAARLREEIHANIGELDALVEEVLLSSRLDATADGIGRERVDLTALAAEEAARVQAVALGSPLQVVGDERLLRRAVRNLLENARRYGGGEVTVELARAGAQVELRVCDRGPGVPEAYRERIFEAFFRLPGHAEREGGVGLGLSLVRQIALRHQGSSRCEPRDGGGSCFVLALPAAA